MGFEPVKEVNVIDVYEIYDYYKNYRNEIKMKFHLRGRFSNDRLTYMWCFNFA